MEATLATLRRLQREDGGNGVGFVQHLGRIMLTNNNIPGRQLSGGGVSRTSYLNTFGCNPPSLFSSGPMSHGFAQAIRTGTEQRATALADHFAPLFASQNPASAAAGMAAAPAMSADESQTAQGATDAEQPQETVAESSTSPTAANPSSTADGADDVDQARTTPAGASKPHSPLPSSSSTSQTAASPVDLDAQWWEQSLSPAKSTDDGRDSTQAGGQEEAQVQPSSVHDHLRRGAMEAKQRQNDAVDRRYSRVSATQAQSVKPGMVVVIPFPKDLKGASGSDVGVKAVVVRLGTRQGYYVVATRYGQLDRELRYEELSVSKTPLVDIPSLMEVYSSQNPQQIVSLKRVSELVNGSSSNSKSQACKCTKKGCWLPSAQDGGMTKRSSCPCRQAGRLCGSGCHSQQSARTGSGCCNKDTQANVRSQAASATPVVHASQQASTHSNSYETPVQSPRAEPTTSKHLRSPVPSSTASTPARASKAAKKSPTDAPHQSAQARSVGAATKRTKKAAVATAAPLAARASASKRFAPPSAHRRLLCYCARNRTTRADSGRCCTGHRPAQRLHAADPSHCPPLQVLTQGPNCERACSTAPAAQASCVQPGCAYAS